ncbi:MAG: WYL domain-containing protein [Treponemataceae bacterium]|nr:WYL domain-containing protein [Treponemataceae bacterium]
MSDKKDLVISLLEKSPQKASELAAALNITTRTVYRWIDKLVADGVPVSATTGRSGGIYLDKSYQPDQETLNKISNVRRASAIEKSLYSSEWIEIAFSDDEKASGLDKIFETCKEAVFTRHVLNFTYHLPNNKVLICSTEPVKFFLHEKEWHILAWIRQVEKFKVFKLEHMSDLQICPEKHERKAEFQIQSLITKK